MADRDDPAWHRHYARVLLTQARVFKLRGQPFYTDLLTWAKRARTRAHAIKPEPRQLELL